MQDNLCVCLGDSLKWFLTSEKRPRLEDFPEEHGLDQALKQHKPGKQRPLMNPSLHHHFSM